MTARAIPLLIATVGLVGANSLTFPPIAGDVATAFPGTVAEDVLRATAAYGLGTALSALTLAPLADRFGAARCLVVALLMLAAAFGASALAPTLSLLLASQAIAGLGAGIALPAAYGLAAELAPPGEEGRTLGRVLTGWTLSLVIGVTASALFSDLVHWRAVFTTLAVGALALALTLRRINLPQKARGRLTSPLSALRIKGIWHGLAVVAALMLSFYGPYTYLGPHLTQALGQSATAAALPVLAYGVGFGLAGRADPLIDRFGYTRLAPAAFASIAVVLGLLGLFSSSFAGIAAVAFAWGLANHMGLNLAVGRLAALDPSQRGAVMGMNSAVTYVSAALAALTFRPVVEAMGFSAAALIASGLVLLAAAEALGRPERQLHAER